MGLGIRHKLGDESAGEGKIRLVWDFSPPNCRPFHGACCNLRIPIVAELVAPGPFNPTGDVNAAFEYGRKRLREQGDKGRTQRQH
jgi:hypothetical protein